jgi:pyridoxamine 5'-phosphate oxidase
VRLSGRVESLTRDEVAIDFAAAPSEVQAMLRACHQGQVIPDRATLERRFAAAVNSVDIDVPPHWGGYRIVIDWIEFWQGRQNWLQDRLRYTRVFSGWVIQRLMP